MADRYELAFVKNAVGATGTNPQEQTALENLLFQRLLTAGLQVSSTGVISTTIPLATAGAFNVKDYGALGDGTTDDSAAIALAYAAVVANGGGTLLFPGPSTYRTTLRINITTSHVTVEGNGSTILFDPSDAVTNDRFLAISSASVSATRAITGAIAVGAATFVAASAGSTTDLVANDWLIVTEFDGIEPFAIDWVQVASVGGTTVTLRAPMRTAFPATHATVQFQRVATLTTDVTVKNLNLRMTATPATSMTGLTVGTARRVTLDHLDFRTLNGSGMSTYLAADLTVTNCQFQAVGLSPEFASTVDLVVSGSTFGNLDTAPSGSAVLIDFGTAFFAFTQNRLLNAGNILMQVAHGVHDGIISGNVLGWCLDVGIGLGQGITGYGCARVAFVGNTLDGGTVGTGNSGIALITDTGVTPNVVSTGNFVGGNLIRGFTYPIPTSPAATDCYVQPNVTTGVLAVPNALTTSTLTATDSVNATNSITTSGGYLVGASATGVAISGAAKAFLVSPADGQAAFKNAAFTSGIGFDFATDGILKVRDKTAASAAAISVTGLVDATDPTKVLGVSLSGMTTAKTLTLASAQATTQTLTLPVIRQAETLAIRPPTYTTLSTPLNPVGTSNTSGLMMGLAGAITPQVTGKIRVTICGQLSNTATNGAKVQIRVGTGTAPVNGGALTGTVYGSQQSITAIVGALSVPFCLSALVTGLTLGTACWLDVDVAALVGGTATIASVAIDAFEL